MPVPESSANEKLILNMNILFSGIFVSFMRFAFDLFSPERIRLAAIGRHKFVYVPRSIYANWFNRLKEHLFRIRLTKTVSFACHRVSGVIQCFFLSLPNACKWIRSRVCLWPHLWQIFPNIQLNFINSRLNTAYLLTHFDAILWNDHSRIFHVFFFLSVHFFLLFLFGTATNNSNNLAYRILNLHYIEYLENYGNFWPISRVSIVYLCALLAVTFVVLVSSVAFTYGVVAMSNAVRV